MADLIHCSYCGNRKPRSEFKRILVGRGSKLRHKFKCLVCISVSSGTQAERDASGKLVTAEASAKQSRVMKALHAAKKGMK